MSGLFLFKAAESLIRHEVAHRTSALLASTRFSLQYQIELTLAYIQSAAHVIVCLCGQSKVASSTLRYNQPYYPP